MAPPYILFHRRLIDIPSAPFYNEAKRRDIMLYDEIIRREPVEKGWSGDKKYHIWTKDGEYLLRVSPRERAARREAEFRRMEAVSALGIPMCDPLEFSIQEEGVCAILRWIDGGDAEAVIPTLTRDEQYRYGLDAGRILKKLHSIPAPADVHDWEEYFNRKIDRKLDAYLACPLRYEGGEHFIRYLSENRHLLKNRPQCYQHGDYHVGNMMIDAGGVLTVIDFDRDDWGDPWEEFNRIVWCAQLSPPFASGMVDGYFGGSVPEEFWRLLALYMSSNALSALPWAVDFGEKEISVMRRQAAEILGWYNNLTRFVPRWYGK